MYGLLLYNMYQAFPVEARNARSAKSHVVRIICQKNVICQDKCKTVLLFHSFVGSSRRAREKTGACRRTRGSDLNLHFKTSGPLYSDINLQFDFIVKQSHFSQNHCLYSDLNLHFKTISLQLKPFSLQDHFIQILTNNLIFL